MPLIETKGAASAQGFGEFAKTGEAVYIESCFSTYLYTGTGSSQTITNGIDLSTKGGLVWLKRRSGAANHQLYDTARGVGNKLASNETTAQASEPLGLTAFNATGFTLGSDGNANGSGSTNVSWTFRKQPKFFDVVTYTGNGSARTIAHSLGSVPGCIVVKRTDTTGDWQVYHRSTGNTKYLVLNSTAAEATSSTRWNDTTPTSTEFSLGTEATVNANGGTYVAYLFAHDAGGFGLTGTDNVISCGSYTGSGFDTAVNLGYEPQFLLIKKSTEAGNWHIVDNMRGFLVGTGDAFLFPNASAAENVSINDIEPTATGFIANSSFESAGVTYIYIAIRRGPMKTPTTGTSVFSPFTRTGTGAAATVTGVGFSPDWVWARPSASSSYDNLVTDKLRGTGVQLATYSTMAELSNSTRITGWTNDGFNLGSEAQYNASGLSIINWCLLRAPGFFDVVCYTGTGSNTTQSHNLGVVPELMIVKRRDTANAWAVYANNDNTDYLVLNTNAATVDDNTYWNDTTPTASVFSIGTNNAVNASGSTYVAYLFATVSGVSKVGSYTGTGTTLQINCGFTGGARFVLIKRTDSTGDWYVWDSARGIVAGNDSYLVLNSTAAEVTNTDWVDTYSAGFELSNAAGNNVNINTATYIFLSVA